MAQMTMGGIGLWRSGGETGRVFIYRDDIDKNRMGMCDWLPKDGDWCVQTNHSGDCFYNYIVIRKTKEGKYKKVNRFGAYCFGKPGRKLTNRQYHLLLAGEPVCLK